MYIKSLHPQPVFLIAGAKVRTKKHPMKKVLIGWEFVGSLSGVLPPFVCLGRVLD